MFKVRVLNDFRNIKSDEVFNFILPITVIVGDNGCGKSSLIHSIRGKFELKSDNSSLFHNDFVKLSTNIEVDTDINKFFFIDSVKDDGSNMNNAYDASSFIESGGFHSKNLSHGETQLFYLSKTLNKIKGYREKSNEKIMLILDEFDRGFSLSNQFKVINILYNINKMYNCDIICISHNYPLIQEFGLVYDMKSRDYVESKDYLLSFKK